MNTRIDWVREKYREERVRRLRPDGVEQYAPLGAHFKDLVADPYVEKRLVRAPISADFDVVIIGTGLGGLLAGATLRKSGVERIAMIDTAGDFGGTWYWNRYPGAACDTEAYIYLPLLEETGYIPTQKYVFGPEIRAHARRIAETFDLAKDALFQTEVEGLHWHDADSQWEVSTDRGDRIRAQHVVMTNGVFPTPKLPGIPGIETFKGKAFHTSRWDYNYTGGDERGDLVGLRDKVVAVIGTGATAVQCVPALAESSKRLFVFQRTPSSVDERRNSPTDPDWVKSLQPGWQRRRLQNFTKVTNGVYDEEDQVRDGWTEIARSVGTVVAGSGGDHSELSAENREELLEIADMQRMDSLRDRIDQIVSDKETAAALKPWYRLFCKRPTFNDYYLQVFNRPNVHLIDTAGKGPDRFEANGVVANGDLYEVDCVVFATGFEAINSYRGAKFEVVGRGEQSLSEHWRSGVKTLHGISSHGFPNYFHMGATLAAFAFNNTHPLTEQAEHIAYLVGECRRRGAGYVEATAEGESRWAEAMASKRQESRFAAECTPGQYNDEGKLSADEEGFLATQYGGGALAYFGLLREWRDVDGKPEVEFGGTPPA